MREVVVFGVGGSGRELHQYLHDANQESRRFHFLGFVDGNPATHGREVHGYEVLGGLEWLAAHPEVGVAMGVGSSPARRKLDELIQNEMITVIHPKAHVGMNVELGPGCVVAAGAILTCDLRAGRLCLFNFGCTVGHDCVFGDYVTCAPGSNVSGTVTLGEGVDLGTGAQVLQNRSIGEWSIIGGGALVHRDLPANVTAVGVPASIIKTREAGWHLQ